MSIHAFDLIKHTMADCLYDAASQTTRSAQPDGVPSCCCEPQHVPAAPCDATRDELSQNMSNASLAYDGLLLDGLLDLHDAAISEHGSTGHEGGIDGVGSSLGETFAGIGGAAAAGAGCSSATPDGACAQGSVQQQGLLHESERSPAEAEQHPHLFAPGTLASWGAHVTEQQSTSAPPSEADGEDGANNKEARKAWSIREDTAILEAVDSIGFKWRAIAAMLPGRSDDAVRNRWNRLLEATRDSKPDQAPTPTAVCRSGYKCSKCGMPKRNHQCTVRDGEEQPLKRGRDLSGRTSWSRAEDEIIRVNYGEMGPRWSMIAAKLEGRTEHAVRNRWHRILSMQDDGSRDGQLPLDGGSAGMSGSSGSLWGGDSATPPSLSPTATSADGQLPPELPYFPGAHAAVALPIARPISVFTQCASQAAQPTGAERQQAVGQASSRQIAHGRGFAYV